MRVPNIQARGALPRPLLLPASAPVENSPKSKGKPAARASSRTQEGKRHPQLPWHLESASEVLLGVLCCPGFFGDKCGWNSWALEPTLWGDPWGFHLGPEVLEGSRVAHPLASCPFPGPPLKVLPTQRTAARIILGRRSGLSLGL